MHLPPDADSHTGLLYAHLATAQAGQVLDILVESAALRIDLPDELVQHADALIDELMRSLIQAED
jgi:hypothetical protein